MEQTLLMEIQQNFISIQLLAQINIDINLQEVTVVGHQL